MWLKKVEPFVREAFTSVPSIFPTLSGQFQRKLEWNNLTLLSYQVPKEFVAFLEIERKFSRFLNLLYIRHRSTKKAL